MLPDSLQVVDQLRQFHVYNVSTTDNWTDRNSKNNFKHTNHISQITKKYAAWFKCIVLLCNRLLQCLFLFFQILSASFLSWPTVGCCTGSCLEYTLTVFIPPEGETTATSYRHIVWGKLRAPFTVSVWMLCAVTLNFYTADPETCVWNGLFRFKKETVM